MPTSVIPRLMRDLRSIQGGFYDRRFRLKHGRTERDAFQAGRSRVKRGMTGVGELALEERFVIIDLFPFF